MDLNDNQKILIEMTVKDLIKDITEDPELLYVRKAAFGYFITENNEAVQVQVTVARDESEFLDFFQTEGVTAF